MIIVVEGPDNSGKTVLALKLAKLLDSIYIKSYHIPIVYSAEILAYQATLEQAETFSPFVISDRHPAISEPIYGSLIRGGHRLRSEDIVHCQEAIHTYVYCRPHLTTILNTLPEREQMEGVRDNISGIISLYDQIFDSLRHEGRIPVYIFNYVTDKPEYLADRLKSHRV
jgi:cytidylate kinase